MVKFYDNDLSMHIYDLFCPYQLRILTLTAILLSAGCEQNNTASVDQAEGQSPAEANREPSVYRGPAQTQFNIGNQSYFFDVSDHTRDEFEALLHRAEEITQMNTEEFDQLDIIMILHGRILTGSGNKIMKRTDNWWIWLQNLMPLVSLTSRPVRLPWTSRVLNSRNCPHLLNRFPMPRMK